MAADTNNLPQLMLHPQTLLARLRDIFKGQTWCLALYEKVIPNMSSEGFCELLKTAAINAIDRNQMAITKHEPSMSYNVNQHEQQTNVPNLVTALFRKPFLLNI